MFQPENNSLIHGYIQWQAETPQTGHSMRTPNMNSIKQTVRLVFYVAVPGLYLIASGKKFSGLALLFVPGMLALFALAYEFEKDLFYFLYMEVGNVLIWVIYVFNFGILAFSLRKAYSQPINLIQTLMGFLFLSTALYPFDIPNDALARISFTNDYYCPYFCNDDLAVYSVPSDPDQITAYSDLILKNDDGFILAITAASPGDTICKEGHWSYFPKDPSINCDGMSTLAEDHFQVVTFDHYEAVTSIVDFEKIEGHAPVVVGNKFEIINQVTGFLIKRIIYWID